MRLGPPACWGIFIFAPVVSLCCAFLFYPAMRARYLFDELETLKLGNSKFEDAQRLAARIGAEPVPYGPCDFSYCEWSTKIGNSKLPRWWRGPGEAFVVTFDVKNGVVIRKNTGYGIGVETDTFSPSSITLEEQENWGRRRIPEPVAAGWSTTDWYRYYQFGVYMTPQASVDDRSRYTAFNFDCFWRYRGCKDARELLPIAATYPVNK